MKKIFSLILLISIIISGYFFIVQPIKESISFPDNMYVTVGDIESINNNTNYSLMKFSLDKNLNVSNNDVIHTNMDIKLFGWIPIKKVKIKLLNNVDVIVGGNTIGFYLNSNGIIVVGSNPIYTENGNIEPIKNGNIKEGDIIKKINGVEIKDIKDIEYELNKRRDLSNLENYTVCVEILRNNQTLNLEVAPALDLFTKKYRLGLWVKNNISGVGTLTYVKTKDNRFGAVGHPIASNEKGESLEISNGDVYLCNFLGIKKGTKDSPGEIKTNIKLSDNSIGIADTNCEYGVYGNIINTSVLENNLKASLSGRMSVKMGDAKIFCDIGDGIKGYDIKIIKTNHQERANEKSIMFKVTDKELIEKTGGIIQGMSGSPIIQDEKLVGAVTHVFLNDPTKAFGVYIDWMIDN